MPDDIDLSHLPMFGYLPASFNTPRTRAPLFREHL